MPPGTPSSGRSSLRRHRRSARSRWRSTPSARKRGPITIYSWLRRRSSLHRSFCFISSGSASWCRESHEPASVDSDHAYLTRRTLSVARMAEEVGRVMTKMRIPALLTTAALLLGACGAGGGPTAATAAPPTEADIDITGPVTLTLWHALTSDPQKGALEASVKKFNET